MFFLISIAFGGLKVTIEQRGPVEPLPTRTIETAGVELDGSAEQSRPGLAKARPALRVIREAV